MSRPTPSHSTLRNFDDGGVGHELLERSTWSLVIVACADPERVDECLTLGRQPLSIGREPPEADSLAIRDRTVSRLHATLAPDGDGWRLTDAGSSNGTFIDGVRTDGGKVGDGSVLRLGDALLVLRRGARAPGSEATALGLRGRSPEMALLRAMIRRVAPSALSVLVVGATGTGKELVAQALHEASGRSGALVTLNSAALPAALVESLLFGHKRGAFTGATSDQEGAMQQADGGTLLLDEVGDMPYDVQPKLLRALETGEVLPLGAAHPVRVDVRVVAATNVPLERAVSDRRFREDLLARLCGVILAVPPLRRRRDDVLALFRHLMVPSHRHVPLSPPAAEALLLHDWPRNVRELQKLAERLPILHPDATIWRIEHFDPSMGAEIRERMASDAQHRVDAPPNREELLGLLAQHGGNVSKLAAAVGRNRKQVYRWMDAHGIDRGTGRD